DSHRPPCRKLCCERTTTRREHCQYIVDSRAHRCALQLQRFAGAAECLAQAREIDDVHRERIAERCIVHLRERPRPGAAAASLATGAASVGITSKAQLHSELYLVGFRKESADIFAGETSEARVFEPQPKCRRDVVAQAHAVVDAVARPPIDRRQRRYESCTGVGLDITES